MQNMTAFFIDTYITQIKDQEKKEYKNTNNELCSKSQGNK